MARHLGLEDVKRRPSQPHRLSSVQMFCTNDVSVAEKICDPDIKVHTLLVSQETQGLGDFKKSLASIFEGELS